MLGESSVPQKTQFDIEISGIQHTAEQTSDLRPQKSNLVP